MKYLSTLLSILFCLLFAENNFAKTDQYRCIWNLDPATRMTVGWNQISGTNPVIYYDTQDYGSDWQSYTNSQGADRTVKSKGMNNHFARLSNLRSSTTYYFVIKDSEGVSRRMFFTTAPDNPYERVSIIAGGDSRNNRDSRRNANLLVSKLRPSCVMFAGDMTASDNATQWPQWFNDWQLTISEDGRITPIIAARGNHEYSNETLVNLFDAPNPQVHYATTIGGNLLRIYTLNSMIAAGGNQAAWLESELRQTTDITWQMAHYHHPIRPHTSRKSEKNKQRTAWATLFYEYGVDLVVECDAHTVKTTWPIRPSTEKGSDEGFIRDDVNGTVYVGEGCWGAPLRANDDTKTWTRNSGRFNQFKWIFVDINGVEVRTVKTDNASSVGSVYAEDVFTPPSNLDIWTPSNGGVIYIAPTSTAMEWDNPEPPPPPKVEKPKPEPKPLATPKPVKEPTETVSTANTSPPIIQNLPPTIQNPPPAVQNPPPVVNSQPSIPITSPDETVTVIRSYPPTVKKTPPPPPPPPPLYINSLQNFTTQVKGEVVHLMVQVKNETEQMFIELQRSLDGVNFYQLEVKPTAEPSAEEKNYNFTDKNALFLNTAKVYYRVKYGSNNTTSDFSAVRSVQMTPWSDYYELQLNPESNLLRIHYALQEKGSVSLYIYNSLGKAEIEQNFKDQQPGDYSRLVDLRGLTSGTYLLQLSSGDERVIRRIVIP